ncbi:unnamed protein product [Rhodiola kirilowii]
MQKKFKRESKESKANPWRKGEEKRIENLLNDAVQNNIFSVSKPKYENSEKTGGLEQNMGRIASQPVGWEFPLIQPTGWTKEQRGVQSSNSSRSTGQVSRSAG